MHRQTLLTDLPSVARRCVARGVQHCAAMVDEELKASVCGATENYRLGAVRWPLRIAALTGASPDGKAREVALALRLGRRNSVMWGLATGGEARAGGLRP